MQKIKTYQQAKEYLYNHIPDGKKFMYPGDFGLRRTKYLLNLLDNPQNKLKVIHIAGTSGKGSTAFFISSILEGCGFKVGLHTSPHLLDLRERFQINNALLPEEQFCSYLNGIVPYIEKMQKNEFGLPTYFEINVALAYYIFNNEQVEYAVIETGLGGLLDGTNVVDRADKVAVITKIGLDHTEILGKTLDKIAFQKAGIIHPFNTVITVKQHSNAIKVIQEEATKKEAKFYIINHQDISHVGLLPTPHFDFQFQKVNLSDVCLSMLGSHQIENASLALATTILLSERDHFPFIEETVKAALKSAVLQGRMQVLTLHNKTVVLDGAHNPQKMTTFIKNITQYFPNQKFDFLIAFKKGKDYRNILKYIVPQARTIIITSFSGDSTTKDQGFKIVSEDPHVIGNLLNKMKFKNYSVIKDNEKALASLFKKGNSVKVITGSLYLMSEVYHQLKTQHLIKA